MNNKKQQPYVFKGIGDAIAYLIISAIIPIVYLATDFSTELTTNTASIAFAFTLLFYFADFSYDYFSRYTDDNEKKDLVLGILLVGTILYFTSTVFTFLCIILNVNGIATPETLNKIYIGMLIASLYSPVICLIELIIFIKKDYKKRKARAINA